MSERTHYVYQTAKMNAYAKCWQLSSSVLKSKSLTIEFLHTGQHKNTMRYEVPHKISNQIALIGVVSTKNCYYNININWKDINWMWYGCNRLGWSKVLLENAAGGIMEELNWTYNQSRCENYHRRGAHNFFWQPIAAWAYSNTEGMFVTSGVTPLESMTAKPRASGGSKDCGPWKID